MGHIDNDDDDDKTNLKQKYYIGMSVFPAKCKLGSKDKLFVFFEDVVSYRILNCINLLSPYRKTTWSRWWAKWTRTGSRALSTARRDISQSATYKSPCRCQICKHKHHTYSFQLSMIPAWDFTAQFVFCLSQNHYVVDTEFYFKIT